MRTEQQLDQAEQACSSLGLDGLVLVGGPVSASDTACLAERFAARGVPTRIVAVPATIDGDLNPLHVEQSIGFDTASKVYASLIGNLATDSASARKYWYFVRLMGRAPSHVALECALHTQPNLTLIGEEIAARRMTLAEVVAEIADTVLDRARQGKHFGVVLIPEGLVAYIAEVSALLREIGTIRRALGKTSATPGGGKVGDTRALLEQMTPWARALLDSLPFFIRQQLLLESTASDDSAQLGQIETERLLATLVLQNLEQRKRDAMLNAEPFCDPKFTTVCFYLGYQAESAPSLPAPPRLPEGRRLPPHNSPDPLPPPSLPILPCRPRRARRCRPTSTATSASHSATARRRSSPRARRATWRARTAWPRPQPSGASAACRSTR